MTTEREKDAFDIDKSETVATLLTIYDNEVRKAEVPDSMQITRMGPLLLTSSPARGSGFVTYASLDEVLDPANPTKAGTALEALIDQVVRHFASDPLIRSFEWKTRGHDNPADLLDRLRAHGFNIQDRETVLMGRAEDVLAVEPALPAGYSLHRAESSEQIHAAVWAASQVFGDNPEDSAAIAKDIVDTWTSNPDAGEMWFIRAPATSDEAEREIVISGRIEFMPGVDVAGLWGAGCHPAHRGKGLYRVLVAARARRALDRGVHYVQADCTAFSRPVLERAGLHAVTTTTPAVWTRATHAS